jgi:hypothetical protein
MKLTWYFAGVVGVVAGCSASGGSNGSSPSGGPVPEGTGGSGTVVSLDGSPPGKRDPNDTRNFDPRTPKCDSTGSCTCLRLALIGTLNSAAAANDTTPFRDWLNNKSGGTATVTMVSGKPVLDANFLGQYDILLVANVNGWTFSADEKAAVANWVQTTAGGIITLTGFVSNSSEPPATSQLVEFAGMGYGQTETAPQGPSQNQPVYYQGGSTNVKQCLHWNGVVGDPQITDPIKINTQTGSMEKLTFKLDYLGAFKGYGVNAPAGATVVADDVLSNQHMAVALEYNATGRIFSWGDEWVILANQWGPPATAVPDNQQQDQYNPCWVPNDGDGGPGFFLSAATIYQTKQFWYDVINWVAPPNECGFTIQDTSVTVY